MFIAPTINITGADRKVAAGYVFQSLRQPEASRRGGRMDLDLGQVCKANARVAKACGRYDHERVFETLRVLLPTVEQIEDPAWTFDSLAVQVIQRLWVSSLFQ